jgi:hypothetical protein
VAFRKIELSASVTESHDGEVEKRRDSKMTSESENVIMSTEEREDKENSSSAREGKRKNSHDGLYDIEISASDSQSHHEDEILNIP